MGFYLTSGDVELGTPKTAYPLAAKDVSGRRYYSTEMGRWVNRDPIEEDGFVAIRFDQTFKDDSLDANDVEFVNNSTGNQIDALGLRTSKGNHPPVPPPPRGQCRIQLCCDEAFGFPNAHCFLAFTDSDNNFTGCRGQASDRNQGGKKPANCKGCGCGKWGTVETECGSTVVGNGEGIRSDLSDVVTGHARCVDVIESGPACNLVTCIRGKMAEINSKCYSYNSVGWTGRGPNCNTAVYSALHACLGDSIPVPNLPLWRGHSYLLPGWNDFGSKMDTCP